MINDWVINQSEWKIEENNATNLSADNNIFAFNVTTLNHQNWTIQSAKETDLFIKRQKN